MLWGEKNQRKSEKENNIVIHFFFHYNLKIKDLKLNKMCLSQSLFFIT